ncbi:MAG: BMC domain-containing protein [Clostridium sp.]|uniref:BMC domain-containing protein n=1 Tax=Clostridium sp. TaxID=1506 RepID=UPI003F3C1D8F
MCKENRSICILEFKTIAKGIEISNEIIKKVNIEILYFRSTCPGKFVFIANGDEGEITEAIKLGGELGEAVLMEQFQINNVHKNILEALKGTVKKNDIGYAAVGILEVSKVSRGLVALDKTLKSSSVELISLKIGFGIGGKLVYIISGELSDIEYGINESERFLNNKGIIGKSIMPVVHESILKGLIRY